MISTSVELHQVGETLRQADQFLILTHRRPDGDTIGSAAALCMGLRQLGKQAYVANNEDLTPRLGFLVEQLLPPADFAPETVIAVDIADPALLTPGQSKYADNVLLCIDHHPSNIGYARWLYLHPEAAATGEMIWTLLMQELEAQMTLPIWEALYIAVATDTGCFKFSNTTAAAHTVAAEAIRAGVDFHRHNHVFFEAKSKCRFEIERKMFDLMRFSPDGRICCSWLEREWLDSIGASDDDLDNLSTLTMSLEEVQCGIILTQNRDTGDYKVSVRTHKPADASRICQAFGGGGHPRAAGCTMKEPASVAMERLMLEAQRELARC